MRFYRIKDDYVEYLRKSDPRIPFNKNETRPYIGIVYLGQNNIKYFIPLGSPKDKHLHMKNTKDFYKIASGRLGVINFNLMIPVSNTNLVTFDLNQEKNKSYRLLMYEQLKELKHNQERIVTQAKELYRICTDPMIKLNSANQKVKERCLDFKHLEKLSERYSDLKKDILSDQNNDKRVNDKTTKMKDFDMDMEH